jgi:hypothetical protein
MIDEMWIVHQFDPWRIVPATNLVVLRFESRIQQTKAKG